MIGILGAGAFGTALAIALGQEGRDIRLWARDPAQARAMQATRQNLAHLPKATLPDSVTVLSDLVALGPCDILLLAMPMQSLGPFLQQHASTLPPAPAIACCKGVDLLTLQGATAVIRIHLPNRDCGVLTGPSFAADIAAGLPTALTLATDSPQRDTLQRQLSTATLRLYLTTDITGAELGGALKNVMAIAAGIVVGAGLGDSARAALMTRGYAEMQRFALALGARADTLTGLSGLGDLILTCTSLQSRNLRYGICLGSGAAFDPTVTVEGVATAQAVAKIARLKAIDMPVTQMVASLIDRTIPLDQAVRSLMSRPLKQE